MPYSGGVFSRLYSWVTDALNGVDINATRMDTEMNGMAAALSTCLLKDGTQTLTANLPMNGYKLTGLANGSASADSAAMGQVQSGAPIWGGTAGGTANALTLSLTPALGTYASGQVVRFLAANNNTGATTLAVNGLVAGNIYKQIPTVDGSTNIIALAGGEIFSGQIVEVIFNGTNWILRPPTQGANFKVGSLTRNIALAGGTVGYTGVGFTPSAVIFLGVVPTTEALSIGFDDGTNHFALSNDYQQTANTWTAALTSSIYLKTASSTAGIGVLASLDQDGFSITWSLAGSPSGTANVFYLAMR